MGRRQICGLGLSSVDDEFAEPAEAIEPLLNELVGGQFLQLVELPFEDLPEEIGLSERIGVGPTDHLGNHLVYDSQPK